MKWTPSWDFLAQMTHVLGATCIIFGGRLLFGWAWWGSLLVVVGWATVKEFLIDPWMEGATLLNGLRDWSFYMLGAGLSLGALLIKELVAMNEFWVGFLVVLAAVYVVVAIIAILLVASVVDPYGDLQYSTLKRWTIAVLVGTFWLPVVSYMAVRYLWYVFVEPL